jgi:ABC-type nitrate/sulfonate/bicarbonate transport system permease component
MNMPAIKQRAVQIGFLIAAGIAWQVTIALGKVNSLILPPLPAVGSRLGRLLLSGSLWPDVGVTFFELVVAFVLAAVAGCALGYAISRSAFSVRVFNPVLATLYAIPMILLYPLFVLLFGIGPGSKIAIGFAIAVFPIVLSTISGFSNVNLTLLMAARSMGASSRQMFVNVMLPASFPIVLAGLRMGLVLALLSILGAETIAAAGGVGHEISAHAESFESAAMYAWMFVAIALALSLNGVATVFERRVWRTAN